MADDRTICQMEVHPLLIKLHRERNELFKKWAVMYRNAYPMNLQEQMQANIGISAMLSALIGDVGSHGIGIARIEPHKFYQSGPDH